MITSIELKNFRKYKKINFSFNNNLVIFAGPNACGKTTVLEAIYLISKAKSHRTNDLSEIIKYDEKYSCCELKDNNSVYKMIISDTGKKVLINDIEYKKISDFIGNIKAVMFSPNDLNLIYGSKSERRSFMDVELSIIDKKYIYYVKQYKKILKERNEILKIYDESKKNILNVITQQLKEIMIPIIEIRKKFINELNMYYCKIHKNLYNEDSFIKYLPSVDIDNIDNIYDEKLSYDLYTKSTNYGIHRDDFSISINDYDAKQYASQGQIRSIVLSLKIALFYMLKNMFGNNIILLLDDVFSELDTDRQNNLVRFLINENQTFISATSENVIPFKLRNKAQIIHIEKEL